MRTNCPNCGAPIEFRYDDSFVRVCPSCTHSVLRTDRGVESLGKVADLAPIESPLALFAEGKWGNESFLLVGMAQIKHPAGGIWQEWYAKLDGGRWGWLAEAQGRYYFTIEQAWLTAPQGVSVGESITIPGVPKPMRVAEVTEASYLGARGELPFRLIPGETFQYADLSDGEGEFATLDFGDEAPKLYVGRQVTLENLHITGGEVAPPSDAPIKSTRLACPSCNAPVDLRVPGESQRAVCSYCNTLLDVNSGALAVLGKLTQKASPRIKLGSKGTFLDGEMTVIGYLQRSAQVEGEWWSFDEYLLWAPGVGYRWLVESDGSWSYVQPIAPGAVNADFGAAIYEKVKFAPYQMSPLRVDVVLGEFYWQVSQGELVDGFDYINPPAMLSRESTGTEENWSLSTFMSPEDVSKAFGDAANISLGHPAGIAPNQPDAWRTAATVMAYGFLALLVIGMVFGLAAKNDTKYTQTVSLGGGPDTAPAPQVGSNSDDQTTAPPNSVFFSEPIQIDGGRNIEISFRSPGLNNDWLYVAADLVAPLSGEVSSGDAAMEYYSGVEDGESWSEGSYESSFVLGPQTPGMYTLRLEAQHGSAGLVNVDVKVVQGVWRGKWFAWALFILGLPLLIVGLVSHFHEKKRWENANAGKAPVTPVAVIIVCVTGLFLVIGAIFKAMAESSSSSDD
ncbi:MAG: DUF4178 domain-containing protein [Kofleriaceae bacterium]